MASDLWTPEAKAATLAHCQAYEGTPHRPRASTPGHGVDCVRFALGAWQAAGMLPEFEWPQYPQGIGLHHETNWMAGLLLTHTHSHSIAVADWTPTDGDIGIFKVGPVSNHIGLVAGGRFWHVTVKRATHHCALAVVMGKLQEAIRLDGPGFRRQPPTHQIV